MSFKDVSTDLIQWVISGHKDDLQVLPMWVMDHGRLNEKRPAYLKVAVPDDWTLNIKGIDPSDVYLMMRVPHSLHEAWVNANASPGAVKAGLGMVASGGNEIGDDPVIE